MTRTPYPYKPNVRLTSKLDEFEQALRTDPENYDNSIDSDRHCGNRLGMGLRAVRWDHLCILLFLVFFWLTLGWLVWG